jgi:uncharacterized protein (TIGR00106 family)
MAIIEVSVTPLGTGTTSVSKYVAEALKLVRAEKGVKYELTGMGTIIEGELGQLLALVRKMHESAFESGAGRVYTVLKIDDRRDKETSIAYKVDSVKKKLG